MMFRRFVTDESGMTLAIAVMMVLLVGVMGAGLLTFVRSDLNSIIEVNRGQRAFDIAEAGVQVAKSHLTIDSYREHYDTVRANDCTTADGGPRVGGDNWSEATDIWNDPSGECNNPTTRTDDGGTPWREDQGVSKTFAGGRFHVTIECFDQYLKASDASVDPCTGGAGAVPETGVAAEERKFFRITSTGYSSADGTGAIRKIEAIYTTAKRTYAPIAYWTPGNIDFSGTKCVKTMSFFAGGNITNTVSGASACGPNGMVADRSSTAIYGDWYAPPFNGTDTGGTQVRRKNASGISINTVGFGAVGRVCGSSQCNSDSDSIADGYNDYDSTIVARGVGQGRNFVYKQSGGQPDPERTLATNEISFPFDPVNAFTGDRTSIVPPDLLEDIRAAAEAQGNYVQLPAGNQTYNINNTNWPVSDNQRVLYFVDAAGRNVDFDVRFAAADKWPNGMVVVRNGNLNLTNNADDRFQGVFIVIGDGTTTGLYKQAGQVQLDGYVSASGNMQVAGNVSPSTSIDYTNLNSFYDVKLWSWRELYK